MGRDVAKKTNSCMNQARNVFAYIGCKCGIMRVWMQDKMKDFL